MRKLALKFNNLIITNSPILILIMIMIVVRFYTAPNFIETREGIFYVRGVVRYSVVELRPYWPGYPVYMWVGKLFNLIIANPVVALHFLAVLASSLCTWPIAKLAQDWWLASSNNNGVEDNSSHAQEEDEVTNKAWLAGLCASLLWMLIPISWLVGSEIFGDPLALLLSLAVMWLCWQSLKAKASHNAATLLISAGLLGGLMLGVRLAYVPPLLVIGYATWVNRHYKFNWQKEGGRFLASPRLILLPWLVLASLGLSVGSWLGWQLALEGWRFIEAGNRQLLGHYVEWGGTALIDQKNIFTRPIRFFQTGLVYGVGGWWLDAPLVRLPATLSVFGLAIVGGTRLVISSLSNSKSRQALILALLWAVPYTLWAIFNYDVDLVRYCFPPIALLCILVGLGLPRQPKLAYLALGAVVLSVAVVSIPLAFEHRTSLPIGQRLTKYVDENLNSASDQLIIQDEVASLVFFMQENLPKFPFTRVLNADLATQIKAFEAQGRTVYSVRLASPTTDNNSTGSISGSGSSSNNQSASEWTPVARLCRSQWLESRGPLEVWIYQHNLTASSNYEYQLSSSFSLPPLPECY